MFSLLPHSHGLCGSVNIIIKFHSVSKYIPLIKNVNGVYFYPHTKGIKVNFQNLMLFIVTTLLLYGCQAENPASKESSTEDLLAQVEAIEADESALLFQQAKSAAKKDNVKEARLLIQRALGRGAGANGMAEAEAEIIKADARIAAKLAEQKRKAEKARLARNAMNTSGTNSYSKGRSDSTAAENEVSYVTIKVNPGSGLSERDLKLTLSREYGRFSDNNGRSNEVQIYKPNSGTIAGNYSWIFTTTYQQSPFHKKEHKSCSGSFPLNGRKAFVMLHISSDCSGYAS